MRSHDHLEKENYNDLFQTCYVINIFFFFCHRYLFLNRVESRAFMFEWWRGKKSWTCSPWEIIFFPSCHSSLLHEGLCMFMHTKKNSLVWCVYSTFNIQYIKIIFSFIHSAVPPWSDLLFHFFLSLFLLLYEHTDGVLNIKEWRMEKLVNRNFSSPYSKYVFMLCFVVN